MTRHNIDTTFYSIIGLYLMTARESAGFSREEVGDALGESAETIAAFEVGDLPYDVDTLYKFCKAIGKDTFSLLMFALNDVRDSLHHQMRYCEQERGASK